MNEEERAEQEWQEDEEPTAPAQAQLKVDQKAEDGQCSSHD